MLMPIINIDFQASINLKKYTYALKFDLEQESYFYCEKGSYIITKRDRLPTLTNTQAFDNSEIYYIDDGIVRSQSFKYFCVSWMGSIQFNWATDSANGTISFDSAYSPVIWFTTDTEIQLKGNDDDYFLLINPTSGSVPSVVPSGDNIPITPDLPPKTIKVYKDPNLKAENIKQGVKIEGITGSLESPTLAENYQLAMKDCSYDDAGFGTLTMTNPPKKITVCKDPYLTPENIKSGVVIEHVTGTLEGGGILKIDPSLEPITLSVSNISLEEKDSGNFDTFEFTCNGGDGKNYYCYLKPDKGIGKVNETDSSYSTTGGKSMMFALEYISGVDRFVGKAWQGAYMTQYRATVVIYSGNEETGYTTKELPITLYNTYCLTGDTLITMWDGTKKRIDQIQPGELVLSLDSNLNKVPGYVYYSDSNQNKTGKHYDYFEFDDGTVIKTVHRHRFYNMEDGMFTHIDNFLLGDTAYKEDGTVTHLVKKSLAHEFVETKHYTIFCNHNTYFANGLLCGNRFSDEISFNKGIAPIANIEKEEIPMVFLMPEVKTDISSVWYNAENKDIMFTYTNGRSSNYYQTGFTEVRGEIYLNPKGDTLANYKNFTTEQILASWDKVADLAYTEDSENVLGKSFDCVVLYVKRNPRPKVMTISSSAENSAGGGVSDQWRCHEDDVTKLNDGIRLTKLS